MAELLPLMEAHVQEVRPRRRNVKHDIDYPLHLRYEEQGLLHLMTVRFNGQLVGYAIAMVGPHLDYKTTCWCSVIKYYLAPQHRRGWTGINMMKFFEEHMRKGKVKVINASEMIDYVTPRKRRTSVLFKRLGYRMVERSFSKEL